MKVYPWTADQLAAEHEANVFARELLIPRALLRKDIRSMQKRPMGFSLTDDKAIKELCQKYEVPIIAMTDQIRAVLSEAKQ